MYTDYSVNRKFIIHLASNCFPRLHSYLLLFRIVSNKEFYHTEEDFLYLLIGNSEVDCQKSDHNLYIRYITPKKFK